MSENKTFKQLNSINVNDKVKSKMNLNYLSWSYAWGELLNNYPDAFMTVYTRSVETVETTVQEDKENAITKTTTTKSTQEIPYFSDGRSCFVKVGVTVSGVEYIEYYPIMGLKNDAIRASSVTMTDVNKALQRAFVKACARHGLGLYIYAGEDLPEEDKKKELEPKEETVKKFVAMQTEMNELGIDFREQYADWILKHSQCESQDLQKLNEPQLQSTIKAYGALIKGYKEKIAKS